MSSKGRTQSVPLRDVRAITNCVYDWVSPEANAASAESAFLNDSTPTQRGGGGVGSSSLPTACLTQGTNAKGISSSTVNAARRRRLGMTASSADVRVL
jgi:hypothetical protein